MKKYLIFLSLFMISTHPLLADIEIHMQSEDGSITKFWVGENRVKMASEETSGFVIVDIGDQKQYMVDHNEKIIIDVTGGLNDATHQHLEENPTDITPAREAGNAIVSIEKIAEGPSIVGFSTDKYTIKANGTLCSEDYLSSAPFRHPEIVELLRVIAIMDNADINDGELYEPCEQAELSLERQYQTLGMPLKSVGPNGVVVSEVVHFQTHQKAPEGTYDFPASYKKTTLRDLLNEQKGMLTPHSQDF